MDGNRANRRVRHFGDVLRINAVVDESPVFAVHIKVVDDGRAIENLRHLAGFDTVTPWMRVAEIPGMHERERAHSQAEVKADADCHAVVKKSDALAIITTRR